MVILAILIRVIFPPYFNIGKKPPIAKVTDNELFTIFVRNPVDAHSRFDQQIILVNGTVNRLEKNTVILGSGMNITKCVLIRNWRYSIPDLKEGQHVLLKGVCRGLDLTEVLVSHCVVITVL